MGTGRLDNTESWLPIGGLEPGFGEYKPEPTAELAGKELTFYFDRDNLVVKYMFHDVSSLTWEVFQGPRKGAADRESYEAILVDPGIYFIDLIKRSDPEQSVNISLDLNTMRATVLVGTLVQEGKNAHRVKQEFLRAVINPPSPGKPVAFHERTTDLIGKRVMYTYSSQHRYEHIYLNDHRYTWHCLAGPEKGLADTEHIDYFKIADDIYLISWWEKVVPCQGVVMTNYKAMRSYGKLFGLDTETGRIINFTMASYAKILNVTKYE